MLVHRVLCFFVAISTRTVLAQANIGSIDVAFFSDEDCNVVGKTSNATIPIGPCIKTIGMGSVSVPVVPCSGEGGAVSVKLFVFSDGSCIKRWRDWTTDLGSCSGAWSEGEAAGSMLLTCSDTTSPIPVGEPLEFTIGQTATNPSGSSGNGTTSTGGGGGTGSTNGSGTGSGSTTSGAGNNVCSGWSCLSTSVKAGIVIGACCAVVLLLILVVLIRILRRRSGSGHHVPGTSVGGSGAPTLGHMQQTSSTTGLRPGYISPPASASPPPFGYGYNSAPSQPGYLSPVLHQPTPQYPPPGSISTELNSQPLTLQRMLRSQQSVSPPNSHDAESLHSGSGAPSSAMYPPFYTPSSTGQRD